ncbi:MAG: B12-binding domain-containing radical SAM protein [Clostridium sp.]
MKFLLTAINAKYIHSNPGVYSLKMFAESKGAAQAVQGDQNPWEDGLPCVPLGAEKQEEHGPYAGVTEKTARESHSMQVEIAEYTINNQMELILEDIYRRKPDMVGISCYIWNIAYALDLVRDIHKVLPDTDIWLGGPEVSYDAPQLLVREPEVFGVMKGEGEEMFAALLECYRTLGCTVRSLGWNEQKNVAAESVADSGRLPELQDRPETARVSEISGNARVSAFWHCMSQVAGLTYHGADGIICDQPIRPVMDMSRIPFLYPSLKGFENRIVYYESSRGCPFSCSYCLSSIDKSVRFRDLKLVLPELDFSGKRVPQVKFVDRTFNAKKSHAMAIWKHILEHDNGVTNFHFEITADLLDEEELELISRMRPGLIQLEIGVQSTNTETIRAIRRKMDLKRLRYVVERINAGKNVHQHLDLIAGLPFEDYESFGRSFNEVYSMEPEQFQLGFLKVLKGSYMHDMVEEYGLKYRGKAPYEVLSTKWLPYSDVLRLKGVEDMVEVYYNSRQFLRTLKLFEQEFESAFAMYEYMAQYYDEQHLTGLNHSRLARYEIFHDLIGQKVEPEQMGVFEDALMCDLYFRENAKSRPSFALPQAPYKEELRRMVPELRTLGIQVHAEVLRSGEVLLFDYREKDRLNHNAKLTVLGRIEA